LVVLIAPDPVVLGFAMASSTREEMILAPIGIGNSDIGAEKTIDGGGPFDLERV
jgi:hypothetical protein